MTDRNKVLARLQARCVKRECCFSDIYKKALAALEGDAEGAEELVASLVKDRFVDDLRYASAFAREKSRLGGWGPAKIRFALRGKGISAEVIEEALGEVDQEDADRKMLSVLSMKAKSLEGDTRKKSKLLRFGLGRGYSYEALSSAVADILSGSEE